MPSLGHKKILVVEDEQDILQLITLYLEKEGFRTVSTKTGAEASDKQNRKSRIWLSST